MKTEESKRYQDLTEKYKIQKLYTEKIEKRMKSLEEQLARIKKEKFVLKDKERKDLMKHNEIAARDILIKQMQFELKKQKDITNLFNVQVQKDQEYETIKTSKKLPVIIINDFTKSDIEFAHKEHGLKDKVVYFKNFKYSIPALTALINFGPKAILNVESKHNSMLNKHKIIARDIVPQIHTFFGSVNSSDLE